MSKDVAVGNRLAELREEYARGETMLSQLESEAAGLRERLLRISGAIQVLEEILEDPEGQEISEQPEIPESQDTRKDDS
ncbi:hypothetical protein EOI86_22870 [Hwanghaeella grinnelliae]|uniref:Uncharacterized protein n=1 Tax=Hwanghaeella grinnelliae TaxID=2500179 RepID=A0A3S2VMH6_9PROT|nr:hypothetical protein [Hwanghaeella grinnelliae]RVU33971.1 hypothetical protein EOI86_22870 [Hwanghaeella grinnelliae]